MSNSAASEAAFPPPETAVEADAAKEPGGPDRSMGKVAVYTALTQLALPLTSLATAPILARELGAHGRGEMAAVVAPILIVSAVAAMGVPEAVAYAVAKLRESPNRVARHADRLCVAYGVLAAALVWFAAPYFLRNAPDVVGLLRAVVIVLPPMMVVLVIRAAVVGTRQYAAAAVERILTPTVRLVGFVAMLLTGTLTVQTAVWLQLLVSLVGGAYLGRALLRAKVEDRTETPAPRLTRELAVFGLRGWGGTLGNLITWRLDQLILVTLVAPSEVGYYVVAVSFAEIIATAVNAVRGVIFTESAHRGSTELIARGGRVMAALVTVGALVGILLAGPVVGLLFGSAFEPSVALTQVLLVASIPFCVDQIVAAGLYAEGHPGMRSVSQIIGAVVTIGGLLILAPHMGAMGAAVASLIAYSVTCLASLVQYRRVTGVPIHRMLFLERSDIAWLSDAATKLRAKLRPRVVEQGPSVVEPVETTPDGHR